MIKMSLSETLRLLIVSEGILLQANGKKMRNFLVESQVEAQNRIVAAICPDLATANRFEIERLLEALELCEGFLSHWNFKELARAQREAINFLVEPLVPKASEEKPKFIIEEE
jgi:hypothetical protein